MRIDRRTLNRTLLARQQLLARGVGTVEDQVGHLVGLQAQENLSPYLSLAARLETFDPHEVTRGLEDRSLVRLLTLRGTIHLLRPADALRLRPWVQPRLDQELRTSQNTREARGVDRVAFDRAVAEALAGGPLPQALLSQALAERLPGIPPAALGGVARLVAPLAQLPPRGTWRGSGGVVYEPVDRWLGAPLVEPDETEVQQLVRRYLRAFGPASAADVTTWSGRTGLASVLTTMSDLVRHEDEGGKVVYDVPEGELTDADAPAPVRLLGLYDNLWLSHSARDRVTEPEARRHWMGSNGGVSCTVFVDGWLAGLWRVAEGRVEVTQTFRRLSRAERGDLDDEVARTEDLLRLGPAGRAGEQR